MPRLVPGPWTAAFAAGLPGESYWFDVGGGLRLGIHVYDAQVSPGNVTLYLECASVDETYHRLSADGFLLESAPEDQFWGRVAYLRDPAGYRVGLMTPPSS